MRGGDAFADGQAEAGPLNVISADGAGVEGEGFTQARCDGRADALASVGDAKLDRLNVQPAAGDGNGAGGCIFGSVVDEIDNQPSDGVGVAVAFQVVGLAG